MYLKEKQEREKKLTYSVSSQMKLSSFNHSATKSSLIPAENLENESYL